MGNDCQCYHNGHSPQMQLNPTPNNRSLNVSKFMLEHSDNNNDNKRPIKNNINIYNNNDNNNNDNDNDDYLNTNVNNNNNNDDQPMLFEKNVPKSRNPNTNPYKNPSNFKRTDKHRKTLAQVKFNSTNFNKLLKSTVDSNPTLNTNGNTNYNATYTHANTNTNPNTNNIALHSPAATQSTFTTSNAIDQAQPFSSFRRKDKRTMSLVQKSKLGSIIHREELRLTVTNGLFVNEIKELPNKKYKILSRIGSGAYGTVYLAENILTKATVAMKKIVKSSEDYLEDNKIEDEINILKNLAHPNIVKILEFYNTGDAYYIINEYCPNGELYNKINNHYSETQLSVIFKQIFSSLCYLHAHNVIHRDLKPENILIEDTEKSSLTKDILYTVKLIDFGTAKIFDKKHKQSHLVGSSYYIAPEVLNLSYNEKCDLWSTGVILYMFLTNEPPFDGETDEEILKSIKKGVFPKTHKNWRKASPELQDLISKLLECNSKKRLSAYEALHHPWFSKVKSNLLYMNIKNETIAEFAQNILSYKITSKFMEMVLAYIIHNNMFNKPKEMKYAIKMFHFCNLNGDGKLTKEELYNALVKYVGEEHLKGFDDVFLMLDGGGKGYIEYEDFLRACLDKKKLLTEEVLVYAFNYFDSDCRGRISVENIKPYFVDANNVSEEVFRNIFSEIDDDKDGLISFQEFKQMLLECYD